MKREDVVEKVTEIAKDVFENEDLIFYDEITANDIEEWDSLTHLSLISDLEDEFDIHFTLDEINNCKNFGELINAIIKHMEA